MSLTSIAKYLAAAVICAAAPALAQPAKTARQITFQADFTKFATLPSGGPGAFANSILPGNNRTLNGSTENEWYYDPAGGLYNPFKVTQAGQLQITAQPVNAVTNANGKPYGSGVITTQGIFSQAFGRWEVKAKLPAGAGMWPAIWILPADGVYEWENDIMEAWQNDPTHIHQTVHGMINGQWQSPNATPTITDATANFHTYWCEWTAATLTFGVDSTTTFTTATPAGMTDPGVLIIDLAIGAPNSWLGTPNTNSPATLDIASIRVYAPLQ